MRRSSSSLYFIFISLCNSLKYIGEWKWISVFQPRVGAIMLSCLTRSFRPDQVENFISSKLTVKAKQRGEENLIISFSKTEIP